MARRGYRIAIAYRGAADAYSDVNRWLRKFICGRRRLSPGWFGSAKFAELGGIARDPQQSGGLADGNLSGRQWRRHHGRDDLPTGTECVHDRDKSDILRGDQRDDHTWQLTAT